MIRRENAHQSNVRSERFLTSEIVAASAANWRRFVGSNQKRMNARVSSSAFLGYASATLIDRYLSLASFTIFGANLRIRSTFTSEDHARAISSARGSVSKPTAWWPRSRDTTTVVPDPTIGSSTRKAFFLGRRRRQRIEGAIRAGKGCTGRSPERRVVIATCEEGLT